MRRLARGLFFDADRDPTFSALVAAHLAVLPAGVTAVDGVSALRLWGVEVGPAQPFRYVTTARHHSVRAEVRVRRTERLPPCTRSVLLPLPALVAARAELDLVGLVVAGDWLVRDGRAALAEVQAALAATTGRDCRRARRAGALVRAGSESVRETRLRLLIVLTGLPEPECNVEIGDERGFIARVEARPRCSDHNGVKRSNPVARAEGTTPRHSASVRRDDLLVAAARHR